MSAKSSPTTPRQKVLQARGRAALWIGLTVVAAMVARLVFSERRDFDAFACDPCGCDGWLRIFHFARQPFLSDAQWIVFLFVVVPATVLALAGLEKRLARARSELRFLGVIDDREAEPPRGWRQHVPTAVAVLVGGTTMVFDLVAYRAYRSATEPDSTSWYFGASWPQVLLVYGLGAFTTGWITYGIIVLNKQAVDFVRGGLSLIARDPMGRLGLYPLADIYDAMMGLVVALAATAFAARIRSSGTIVEFAAAVESQSLTELLATSKWRLRWPNVEETPLLLLNLAALVAVCWFPLHDIAKRRRAELWWRLAILRQLEAGADPLPAKDRAERDEHGEGDLDVLSPSQERRLRELAKALQTPAAKPQDAALAAEQKRRASARALREEIQLVESSTVWPNGAERGGALMALSALFLIGGAAPILMVPLLALAVLLGVVTRVSGLLQLALSGQAKIASHVGAEPEEEQPASSGSG